MNRANDAKIYLCIALPPVFPEIKTMPVRPIITIPDRRLETRCRAIKTIDQGVLDLCADLDDTLQATPDGIGLAAPQIGITRQVTVLDLRLGQSRRDIIALINPVIEERSADTATGEEGCLSIPGYLAMIPRAKNVRVRYLDRQGRTKNLDADGLLAVCIQHECDHLNGVLFLDYLSSLKRSIALRRVRKWHRTQANAT